MYKPFWALLFILSCTYSAAFADDPTSESKGWGGVAPAPSENECRSFIEAALKEQRQAEAGGGDAVEEASSIAPEDQINAVNQVNEETTADASTENIESTQPSDAVEETNERVEISEIEPAEPETPIEQEQAALETPEESVEVEGTAPESIETEPEELVTESIEAEGVLAESVEAETESTETAETNAHAEPEELVTESTETEGVPAESSEAKTEDNTESIEAEGALVESAEAEPEEVLDKAEEAVAESAPTESAETDVPASNEETQSDMTEKELEEVLEREIAESVEGETVQSTEESISAEEVVKDRGEDAAEEVVPESIETEAEPEEPMSDEELMLGDQPVESDASGEAPTEQETEISQETGSEQVEEQSSVEQEQAATEQPEVQEAEPEEIVENVVQEEVENVNVPVTEEEPIATETEPVEEQIREEVDPINQVVEPSEEQQTKQVIENSENIQPTSEATIEVHEHSSETPDSPEATHEEPPVTNTEEATPTTAEESPATNANVEETPAESAASVEQESAPEPQTEEVSEPQAEAAAVAVDEGMEEEIPEQEDLTLNIEIPENLRSRNHISEVLRLDVGSIDTEAKLLKAEESTLKELKRVYEAAIKPLEILYKYRDLSNRHFGDPEIFSKPLILFMGPWSGGKSTIINYLLDNEYKQTSLRTGAEPSPAYFNIVMWGEREEVMDGTQLAADWTFSGLQKFGQGLLDRLRGLRLNSPLLEKVNIVEIPGILEIRKQVERLFPLNDACQWFIDRADIIFLVYDPSKLDVGPETEAILDQLKGREYQTKIILNKADQVKPEELMRVQGTLIWNISPLMSSTEPPVMYSTSLWSHPYQPGSPSRLLFAQEKAFLKDLRAAMEKRVENKISSARRFAVRVRNHAKMVDCYLTTYYNHKTFFGNKEKVSEDIIEHPQNYHIYEGLSTLTNISRYDLPDPDVYRDFFRLNPVYDFQQLASTCTYFKGCPINRLDVAIAYDLPELVGRYKKVAEDVKSQGKK